MPINAIVNYLCYIKLICFGITFELWMICKQPIKRSGIYHCVCMSARILVHKDHYWLAKSLVPAPRQCTLPRSNLTDQWLVNFSTTIIFNFTIVKKTWRKLEYFWRKLRTEKGKIRIKRGHFVMAKWKQWLGIGKIVCCVGTGERSVWKGKRVRKLTKPKRGMYWRFARKPFVWVKREIIYIYIYMGSIFTGIRMGRHPKKQLSKY